MPQVEELKNLRVGWLRTLTGAVECESKIVNLHVSLCSYPHVWWQALSSDWKKENANTSSYRVRSSVTGESCYFTTLKSSGHFLVEVFQTCPYRERACRRLRIFCRDDIFWQPWELLDVPLDEIEEVAGERENWGILLRLLPSRPSLGWAAESGSVDECLS